jgi:hypothetical protein
LEPVAIFIGKQLSAISRQLSAIRKNCCTPKVVSQELIKEKKRHEQRD